VGTGAKVALGCGIAVVLAGVGFMVVVVGGTWWIKGKAEKMVGGASAKLEEMSKYEKQANQNPFTPPADGAIQEPQLVKFLAVRKEIYTVYEQHKPEFDSLSARTKDKKDLSLSETVEGASLVARLFADVRLVQMKALAAAGMSEPEYRFVQQAVYFSGWASEFQKESGKQPADLMDEAIKQSGAGTETLRKGAEAGGISLPPEADLKGADEVLKQLKPKTDALRVPQGNIALFRKYEADIKKYAMTGLAAIGL